MPRDVSTQMFIAALQTAYVAFDSEGKPHVGNMDAAIKAALAAAPEYVGPVVSDEIAATVVSEWFRRNSSNSIESGRDMIAAVQQVLGPALGLVPREWVEDAYREGANTRGAFSTTEVLWKNSAARKRIEGSGNG